MDARFSCVLRRVFRDLWGVCDWTQSVSRHQIDYTARRALDRTYSGFDPDKPIAGFYRMRLRSGAAPCGIRIWYGPPLDPVTSEELDRSHRWQAQANGEYIDLERVWPQCARERIDQGEYHHLCAVKTWAQENAPKSPLADPRRKADPLDTPILF